MYLKSIRIQNFRNHKDSTFEFGDRTNVLLGDNGQGKTNVIEAISYLCLTKSFYSHSDSYAVKIGTNIFEIDGTITSNQTEDQYLRVAYSEPLEEKIFSINKHRIEPFSSVIGKFPVVICSPEHAPITLSGPSERRKFIDFIISQSNAAYFQRLLEFRKIIRNRNKILFEEKHRRNNITVLLESWNEQLINCGSYIILKRKQFIDEFQPYMQSSYCNLVNGDEEPTIEYESLDEIRTLKDEKEISEELRNELSVKGENERKLGTTLVGPHRDELCFKINGLNLRKFASQGQHKTFLVALKVGEFFYLRERCKETPILLLDDIFSELDDDRAKRLLDFVEVLSQTFITSTNPYLFENRTMPENHCRIFHIHGGAVVDRKTFAA